jgi:DNA-binding XRE family transcriptional regulator
MGTTHNASRIRIAVNKFRLLTEDSTIVGKAKFLPETPETIGTVRMKDHNIAFGQVLRTLRKEKHLSQEELGFESRRDRTYISLLELGQRSPTLDTMIAICSALNITLPELVIKFQEKIEQLHDVE